MATYYSQASGKWSTLSNWNDIIDGSGSSPISIAAMDDNSFVIQSGHVIEFDIEDSIACDGSISGWTTGIAGITITGSAAGTPGELTLTDTVNNANRVYGLRLKANTAIVGTNVAVLGKVTGGTSSVPLPSGAVHIIQFLNPPTTGGFNLTYLSLALYCAPPVETAYVLTANAGIGDSVLSVEGRLTGCNPNTDTTEWQVGRAVRVIRTTSAGVNTQATTIAAVGDGTITLADNLTVAKPAGSLVVLQQRNIEIRDSAATSDGRNLVANGTSAIIDCAIRSMRSAASGTRGIYSGTSHTVQGSAVISGCSSGIHLGTSHTVQGSAVISGCTAGIYAGTSHVVQGSATISGCTYGIYSGTSHTVQGSATIAGCTRGISAGTSHVVQGSATISGCSSGIYQVANALVAHTASITGCNTNYQVNTADDSVFSYTTPANGTDVYSVYKLNVAPAVATPRVEIWPTGYEAAGTGDVTRRYPSTYIYGEYPATWCNGGKTQSQSSVLPTGHTVGGQMIFEQHADIISAGIKANYCWNWVSFPFSVTAGSTKTFTIYVRKDTSFSGYTETPIIEIVDTLYDGANIDLTAAVETVSMEDNEDTWQKYILQTDVAGDYFVRIRGRHDTGTLYYVVTEDQTTWYSQGSSTWSDLSNWNDAADGSGLEPREVYYFNNQKVVIQAGHVIEFDVEDAVACDGSVSGWTTGIAGITITGSAAGTPGELTLTDTVNNANRVYGLRLKANTAIVGTNVAVLGKVTGGTSSVPLPSGAVHIIQFVDPPTTGGFDLTYLSLALYAAQPVETAYVTTAAAGVGDSVLSVQGRLTSCNPDTDTAEWQVGRAVRVVRTTSAGANTQATTIAAVGDGTITLGDNLTVAKPAGSLVVLEQRNIEIRDSAATSNNRNLIANGTGAVLDCAIRSMRSSASGTRAIYLGTSHVVHGSATISGCTYGIYYGTSHVVQGSATISGCTVGINAGTSNVVQGSAVISGGKYGFYAGTSHIVQGSGVISGCTFGICFGTSHIVQESGVISGCAFGIYRSVNALVAHTASITGCGTNYSCDTADSSVFSYATPAGGSDVGGTYKFNVAPAVATPRVEIWPTGYEAAGTAEVTRRYPSTFIEDSYPKTWGNGGKTEPQTSVLPTGFTTGGKMIFEQHADIISDGIKANYCWNWVSFPFSVTAGSTKTFTIYVRKDTSFSGYTETPIIEIVDTLYDGTNIDLTAAVETVSMEDNEDTWQKYILQTDVAGDYFVRIRGRHDTGTLYYVVTEDQTTWYSQGSSTWSDLSNWNDAADGSGLEPREVYYFNNQKVVIQAGHVIEFDVEDAVAVDGSVSGWTTGIAGITIQGSNTSPGELTLSTTNNNANRIYGLRIKENYNISGTNAGIFGKFTGGNESSPIPSGAVHIIKHIDPPNTGGIDLKYLSFAVYAASPIETAYVLTSAASAGDTVLSIEGRLTACNPNTDTTEWQVGRNIRIVRVAPGWKSYPNSIASINDGTITLSSPMQEDMAAGALVILEQRNVEFRFSGRNTCFRNGANAIFSSVSIFCEAPSYTGQNCVYNGKEHIFTGGSIITSAQMALSYCNSCIIQGNTVICYCTGVIYFGTSNIIQGNTLICGAYNNIYRTTGCTIQGNTNIKGCYSGFDTCTSCTLTGNAIISECTDGIDMSTSCTIKENAKILNCIRGIYGGIENIIEGNANIDYCTYGIIDTGTTENNGTIIQGNATITNCTAGIYGGKGNLLRENASISSCTYGIQEGSYHKIIENASISSCTYGIYRSINCLIQEASLINNATQFVINYRVNAADSGSIFAYNANILGGALINNSYLTTGVPRNNSTPRLEIWPEPYEPTENEQKWPKEYNSGIYPTWYCNGGYGETQSIVVPNGFSFAAKMTFEQPTDKTEDDYAFNWIAFPFLPLEGTTSIKVTLRKNTSFSGANTPKIEIIPQLYDGNDIYMGEAYRSINIFNENDKWRTYHLKISSDGANIFAMEPVFLRIIGAQESGDIFFVLEIEPYVPEQKEGLQLSLHAKHLIKNGASGHDMWQHPLLAEGERPWGILTAPSVSRTYLAGAGEGFKYYFAGGNTAAWYAGDRAAETFYSMPELKFNINVNNIHMGSFLGFNIPIENSKGMGELTFSLKVLLQKTQMENLTDEEYAAYFGYKLPLWNKIENSDNIENIRQFGELKSIRSLMSEIGPPNLFDSNRAGPFAWNKYDYVDNAEDSNDKDSSEIEKFEKIAGIDDINAGEDKSEDFSKSNAATNNIIVGSNWGLWLGENNHGVSINRLYHLWDNKNNPLVFINGNNIAPNEYTEDYISQSIVLNTSASIDDILLMEKDFKEYYLDDPWEIDNADIFVYINNKLANISWTADKKKGLIRFKESLRSTDIVTVSILKEGAYLTNVGTHSHFELDGFEDNLKYVTELTEELKDTNNSYITVASTKNFPASTQYIKIGNTERIHVAIDSQNKDQNTFKIITARSNPISWGKGTQVVLSEVVSTWGIQDILSKYTSSNVSYNMHSLFISNLIRATLAIKEHFPNADGPTHSLPDGWDGEDGQIQKYYIDMNSSGTDYDLDELNSWTTLHRGIQPSYDDDPYQPLIIYCNYGQMYAEGSLLGTDHGIWQYSNEQWQRVCRCIRHYSDGTKEKSCRIYGFKDFRNELWAFTDVGVWTSKDFGKTWKENALYYQCIYDISCGTIDWWSSHNDVGWGTGTTSQFNNTNESKDHFYEIFSKEDGMVMVLYKDPSAAKGTGEFWSDFEEGPDNYIFKQYETKSNGDNAFIGKNEDLKYAYDDEEDENRVIFSTNSILNKENMLSHTTKTRMKFNTDGKQEEEKYQEKLKFYKMILNPSLSEEKVETINESNRHGAGLAEIIFLTNDGIRISNHNWLHMSKDGHVQTITFDHIALDGKDINCNCYLVIESAAHYYTLLLGTNKGIFYSLDGGYSWAHMIKRFPNGGKTVFNLVYDQTLSRLYAFTDAGIVFSNDLGDSWTRSNNPSSGHLLLENRKIAQIFTAINTDITKASVYLDRQKHTNIQYLYEETTTPQITLGLYDTLDNKPNNLIGYSSTIYNFADISCSNWYNFDLSNIGQLEIDKKYAIVLETSFSGLSTEEYVRWISSSIKSSSSGLLINDGTWNEVENTNAFFMIHYDADNLPEITEYTVKYSQKNANNIAVKNTYDSLYLDMRFMLSFILDDTGTMKWMDKEDNRGIKALQLINQILSRSRWSYVDIWAMGNDLKNLLAYGPSRDASTEIPAALGTLLSSGKNSEIWTGAILASGGINEVGVNAVLERENAYSWAIDYMNSMYRIDNDVLLEMDPTYTGDATDLMLDKYKDIRNYVLQDFSDTYCRAVFYFTDGFDSASHKNDSWEDLALAINSLKFVDGKVPLYIFGLGEDNAQSGLIQACEATNGKYFNIGKNVGKWEEAIDSIVDGNRIGDEITRKDTYLWKGKYEDFIDFGENAQYIKSINLPATVPSTAKVEFRIRWTKDFISWTPWREYDINIDNEINAYAIYLEYEIILYQGDLVPGSPENFIDSENDPYGYDQETGGNYPSPVVGALKYKIVTPSRNIYMMNEHIEENSILEYLLTTNSSIPKDAKINWKLLRGTCHNWEIFEDLHAERKGVLPIRTGTIYFTPDMEQKNIRLNPIASGTDPTKTISWAAVDKNNDPITWGNNAEITVYLNGEEQIEGEDLQPLALGKDYGLILFVNPKDIVSNVIMDIVYPGSLQISNGEMITRINENTIRVQNGPWSPDADVCVYINGIPHTDNFWVFPEEGKIVFKNPIDNDDITVSISLTNVNRLGYETINYSNSPLTIDKAGLMYSTNIENSKSYDFSNYTTGYSSNFPELLSIFKQKTIFEQALGTNQEQTINIIIGNMNSKPYIDYEFKHIYNYPEANTKIIWERNRTGTWEEINALEDKLSMPLNTEIVPYGSDDSNLFIEGDIFRAKIYLRTSLVERGEYITNEFRLGEPNAFNYLPILKNVKLYYLKTDDITYTKPSILPDNNPVSLLTKNIIEIDKVGYRDETGTLYNVYEFQADKLSRIWIKCEFAIDGINDENNLKAAIDRIIKYSRIQWFNSKSDKNIPVHDNYIKSRSTTTNPYANWSLSSSEMVENEEYWYAVITPRLNPPELINESTIIMNPLELDSNIQTNYIGESYPSGNFAQRIRVENIMKLPKNRE